MEPAISKSLFNPDRIMSNLLKDVYSDTGGDITPAEAGDKPLREALHSVWI